MAIKNGNSDFNLYCIQYDQSKIQISWYKKDHTGVSLEVYRPGDGKQIYSKSYTTASSGSELVTIPYIGEYKIKIHTNRGYSYDVDYVKMNLIGNPVSIYTFTQADVDKWKQEDLIVKTTLFMIGFPAMSSIIKTLTFKRLVTLTGITAFLTSIAATLAHDTPKEGIGAPRAGYKLRTDIAHSNGKIRSITVMTDPNGNEQPGSRRLEYNYLTFTR